MSQVELAGQSWQLERYPPTTDPTLQAWEAADEYLLQEAWQPEITGPVLIFNDTFGALACALNAYHPICISDSFLSQEATRRNLLRHGLPLDQVSLLGSLDPLPAAPGLVLLKVPKTLALLEQQLLALRGVITAQTRILAAAKARDIHRSSLELFERILGPTRTSLAWKKARLIFCTPADRPRQANPYPTVWTLENHPYRISNHANVFSRASLDIGARFFLTHLPVHLQGQVADLGCGNGVLGLHVLASSPEADVWFVDESHMALASSAQNVRDNRPEEMARCHFHLGNSLEGLPDDSLDTVLCNPPFHQLQTITDELAWQMFRDAQRCLKHGGSLWMVGNRHLGYHIKLKRLFGKVDCLASNQKFVILRAVKS